MLSYIWVIMVCTAVASGAVNGRLEEVGNAALEGAGAAVTLCLGILASVCLWCGLMELLKAGGIADLIRKALNPFLKKLFPQSAKEPAVIEKISANVCANILGLGNAATPLGMAAAAELGKRCINKTASNELCRLVVLNTASLQIVPATIAAVRASLKAAAPFDILPAVWISSFASLIAGLTASLISEKLSRRKNGLVSGRIEKEAALQERRQ